MRWAEIKVNAIPTAVDAVGNCLNEIGCNGFVVNDNADPYEISGYVPVDDRLEGRLDNLSEALARLPDFGITGVDTGITLKYVEEDDWANAWKAYYKPMRIGNHIIVTPPWEDADALADDIIIVIDPGMAFGTGSHPTTRLCLASLEQYVKPGMQVADIGTGSGILSICAAKLGAKVSANDIDPLAVKIAGDNAKVNNIDISLSEKMPEGKFDIVVANILADVIIGLSDELIARIKEGGILITSGIIENREEDVKNALTAHGMRCIETKREGEWVAIIFQP